MMANDTGDPPTPFRGRNEKLKIEMSNQTAQDPAKQFPPLRGGGLGRGSTTMIDYSIAIMGTKPGTKKADITETKAYGTAQVHEVLSFDDFCKHIADHNSPFSKGCIKGVLTDAVACIREQLLAGNKVNLGDLGAFYVELKTEGAVTTEDFSALNILEVKPTWVPGERFQNLRSEAEFNLVPSRAAQTDDIKVIKNTETIQGLE